MDFQSTRFNQLRNPKISHLQKLVFSNKNIEALYISVIYMIRVERVQRQRSFIEINPELLFVYINSSLAMLFENLYKL